MLLVLLAPTLRKAVAAGQNAELTRFLHIARGSAVELENHLLLARDLDYLPGNKCDEFVKRVDEVQRMLTAFIQQVQPVQHVKKPMRAS